MKTFRYLFIFLLITPFIQCTAQPNNKEVTAGDPDKIEVYYFHFTARCVTCRNIEAKAKENIELLYPVQVKQGLITFQSVNLEEPEGKPLAGKLGVAGQTLLIVKGTKKINITNEGFMYAGVKPEKFKEIINEKIEGLLSKK